MRSLRHALAWPAVVAAAWATCEQTHADLFLDEWTPTLHMQWWISDLGAGNVHVVAEPEGEAIWSVSGYFGDAMRLLAWSLIVDDTSGSPVIEVQSLIAKNYSLADVSFGFSVDLELAEAMDVADNLKGELHVILAGVDGTLSTPKTAPWMWSLRSDEQVAGGVFAPPWSMHVDSGSTSASGGIHLDLEEAPDSSFGFGWDLTLTSGEAASATGLVAVPAPATLTLLVVAGLRGRRSRRP